MAEKIQKSDAEWKKVLNANQCYVTRQKGTQPPFTGVYENSESPGTYKCICCGQELFLSDHKVSLGVGLAELLRCDESAAVEENRGHFARDDADRGNVQSLRRTFRPRV